MIKHKKEEIVGIRIIKTFLVINGFFVSNWQLEKQFKCPKGK